MDETDGTGYNYVTMTSSDTPVPGLERSPRRPTIRTVAEKAGVSVGTVSRVLNNHPNVHRATRERVVAAMEALKYRPDVTARELSVGQRPTIGLTVAQGNNRLIPFLYLFLKHLTTTAIDDGFHFEEIEPDSRGLPERLPDGLLLFGAHDADPRIDYLKSRNVPFVLIGHGHDCATVVGDDVSGAQQAANHLLRLGHQSMVHITGDFGNQGAQDRLQAFRQALEENGLSLPEDYVLDGGFTQLGGYRAMRTFLSTGKRFTAVFAASDEMAVGAIAALQDEGFRVPQDVSVVGYDDLPEIGQGLTTIHQAIPELAGAAIETVARQMAGHEPEHRILPVQLVARDTTARAPEH